MVLENKLVIRDPSLLADAEEKISKKKALELFDSGALEVMEPGSYTALSLIHKHLFADIYEFAGRLRTTDIISGHSCFAPVSCLESAISYIDRMPQSTFDEIVEKYVETYVAHPFRAGNNRCGRIWLDHMLSRELGTAVNWYYVNKRVYLLSMEHSVTNDAEVKRLLRSSLLKHPGDRSAYMKRIDGIYYLSGFASYTCKEIDVATHDVTGMQ